MEAYGFILRFLMILYIIQISHRSAAKAESPRDVKWPRGCIDCFFSGSICCKFGNGTESCEDEKNCPTYVDENGISTSEEKSSEENENDIEINLNINLNGLSGKKLASGRSRTTSRQQKKRFFLHGTSGGESVTIDDGGRNRTFTLTKNKQPFYAIRDKITIYFLNDACCNPDRNVMFTSVHPHLIQSNNRTGATKLNCDVCKISWSQVLSMRGIEDRCKSGMNGKQDDCDKCLLLRSGQFCWGGSYDITFAGKPIPKPNWDLYTPKTSARTLTDSSNKRNVAARSAVDDIKKVVEGGKALVKLGKQVWDTLGK